MFILLMEWLLIMFAIYEKYMAELRWWTNLQYGWLKYDDEKNFMIVLWCLH